MRKVQEKCKKKLEEGFEQGFKAQQRCYGSHGIHTQ